MQSNLKFNLVFDVSTSINIGIKIFEDEKVDPQYIIYNNIETDDWFSNMFNQLTDNYKSLPQEIYYGQGPGSFTGLKVCFTYLKTFAVFHQIQFFHFPSFELHRLLFKVPAHSIYIWPVNRNQLYIQGLNLPSQLIELLKAKEIMSSLYDIKMKTFLSNFKLLDDSLRKRILLNPNAFRIKINSLNELEINKVDEPRINNKQINKFMQNEKYSTPIDISADVPIYGHNLQFG